MGMFSTTDGISSRFLKIYLVIDGRRIPASYDPEDWRMVNGLWTEPTESKLGTFVEYLNSRNWIMYAKRNLDDEIHVARNIRQSELDARKLEPIEFDHVIAEVWRITYKSEGSVLQATRIISNSFETLP